MSRSNSQRLTCQLSAPPVVAFLTSLCLMLSACTRVSEDELLSAAQLLLKDQLGVAYRDEFHSGWGRGAPWSEIPASVLDNDRLPMWAQDIYTACIYWEAPFRYEQTVQQRGPDLVKLREGVGWGWVFFNRELEFHIAELGMRWQESEDGVETGVGEKLVVEAWESASDD